jgi:hypothetical protein
VRRYLAGAPGNMVNIRTYADLLQLKFSSSHGTCCACHKWNVETWSLSTRANICRECIERKGDAVLGSIVRGENKVRRWLKPHGAPTDRDLEFIGRIFGVDPERVRAIRDEVSK